MKAEDQLHLYVVMLGRQGRVQEAVEEGLRYLDEPAQFLSLARTLREREERVSDEPQETSDAGMAVGTGPD